MRVFSLLTGVCGGFLALVLAWTFGIYGPGQITAKTYSDIWIEFGVNGLFLFGGAGIGKLMASFQKKLPYLFAVVVGGWAGYFAATIAANLEDIQFYAIRRWVTGKSVLMEIVYHPADR
jgi:hypothetical protein